MIRGWLRKRREKKFWRYANELIDYYEQHPKISERFGDATIALIHHICWNRNHGWGYHPHKVSEKVYLKGLDLMPHKLAYSQLQLEFGWRRLSP